MDKKRKYDEIGCDCAFENKKFKTFQELSNKRKNEDDCVNEFISNKKQKTLSDYEQIIANLNLKNQILQHELKVLNENYANLNKQIVSLRDKLSYYNVPHYIS
jgi:predicted  nucleic acid-binding Zn-ribbon protein